MVLFAHGAEYPISPKTGLIGAQIGESENTLSEPLSPQPSPFLAENKKIAGILSVADDLSVAFGSRPHYDGTKFKKGQYLMPSQTIYAAPFILACESAKDSDGRLISKKILDSNGKFSYGIAMFQKGTWDKFSLESGIIGDPMIKEDAVKMLLWGLENGKASHWTCSYILKVL